MSLKEENVQLEAGCVIHNSPVLRDLSQIRNQLPRVVRKVQTACEKLADKQNQENAANEQKIQNQKKKLAQSEAKLLEQEKVFQQSKDELVKEQQALEHQFV